MHARHHTGKPNGRYAGTTPRAAQAYLHRVWRLAMRQLQREGIKLRGLRTVEPHHDACPHWHVLVFAQLADLQRAIDVIRVGALDDSPDEPGAELHRFTAKHIDPAEGCAVSYVSKYVAKSIDGHGVDEDDETGADGASTAERIVAWSRTWGVRQFQFFGLPPVTPKRELYRVSAEGIEHPGLALVHQASKENDLAAYLAAMEGHSLRLGTVYLAKPSSRYPGETVRAIHGVSAHGADLAAPIEIVTRTERWCIQPKASARASATPGAPWTRINNCASPDGSSTYARRDQAPNESRANHAREGRRRRPAAAFQGALALT